MQYRNALQGLQGRALAGIGEQQWRETDLLAATGNDAGAERARHQLRAEADAEGWPLLLQATPQQGDAVGDEGIGFCVIGTDRATQHDQQFGCFGIVERVDTGLQHLQLPALRQQQRLQPSLAQRRDVGARPANQPAADAAS
ncbi:hypothetical protein G6F62_014270 [Rhizopus arrhizus]|nr:hypothetical protein G6F62_014270 [Rhizopus arrhizus]